MIHLLTAIGLQPGGSSTVHIYAEKIHRTTQNKQYIEQLKNFGKAQKFWEQHKHFGNNIKISSHLRLINL
jgi:hypothetical protein